MSLYPEYLDNGKVKWRKRWVCPVTGKVKKFSVTLSSDSTQAKNKARREIELRIAKYEKRRDALNYTFKEVAEEYKALKQQAIKDSTFKTYCCWYNTLLSYIDDDLLIADII